MSSEDSIDVCCFLEIFHKKSARRSILDAHNAWIQQGLDDGVFLLVGSLEQGQGGAILADNAELQDLHKRVNDDPFVAAQVVVAEIHEITPHTTDQRLSFLVG